MTNVAIAQQRLQNHHLSHPQLQQPDAIVAWLGAVQAQDYAGAKWALAQRMPGATDAAIEQAFTDGTILRTHLLRPTWHFVTPADIRWMLALTAPRVHALNAYYYRKCELDETIFARSHDALVNALQGGKQLMREEVRTVLEQAGIATKGELRFAYLLMHAELDGVVCSGARHGKQFTYALLAERVPPTRQLDRDEALAELVRRYFTSHGPATVQDFVWWSGLTVADANAGIALAGQSLGQEVFEGKRYWQATTRSTVQEPPLRAYLLATYDEYLLSYADRSAVLDAQDGEAWNAISTRFTCSIVIGGRVVGVWRRTFKKGSVVIESTFFRPLTTSETNLFTEATERFGEFLGMPVVIYADAPPRPPR